DRRRGPSGRGQRDRGRLGVADGSKRLRGAGELSARPAMGRRRHDRRRKRSRGCRQRMPRRPVRDPRCRERRHARRAQPHGDAMVGDPRARRAQHRRPLEPRVARHARGERRGERRAGNRDRPPARRALRHRRRDRTGADDTVVSDSWFHDCRIGLLVWEAGTVAVTNTAISEPRDHAVVADREVELAGNHLDGDVWIGTP
ncbi:MAG: hypothetical protein QOI44_602, partial [Actinomycetota bacterium]|nr:hypothetical protein [Actinomycetota bacterium]